MEASVYWLRLENHSDIFSEGYVGVSYNPDGRLSRHMRLVESGEHENAHLINAIRKSGNTIVQDIVAIGDEKYCYSLEAKLRPEREIGWNINRGGEKPPSCKTKVWINNGSKETRVEYSDLDKYEGWKRGRLYTHSEQEKKRRSIKYSGKGNPFYGKKHDPETIERFSQSLMGRSSWTAKPIKFRGIQYDSISDASRKTGITKWFIQKEVSKNESKRGTKTITSSSN
jgi:group I intron endonuclease